MRLITLLGLLAVGSLDACHAAWADERYEYVDLVCGGSSAMAEIRFTVAWNDDPPNYRVLPDDIDGGLSHAPAGEATDCQLPDGRRIRIRAGVEQAFAYGMGGADPPAFFSLWIDRRIVLARREWKPGYGSPSDRRFVAVVVRADELVTCEAVGEAATLDCHSEPLDLTRHPVDTVEYPPSGQERPPIGTVLIAGGAPDPSLCRRYLDQASGTVDDPYTVFESAFASGIEFTGLHTLYPTTPGLALARVAPDGPVYRIAWFGGETHFFDGDIMLLAPADTPVERITALTEDIEITALRTPPDGWVFVSGDTAAAYPGATNRYIHLMPLRIDGRLYFLATPTNRDERPTAMLVGLGNDLQPFTACEFDRVEPNFGVQPRQ